jgi:phage terminase small subunit
MIPDETIADDRRYDGKAMSLLNDKQRRFVIEMLQRGVAKKSCMGAASAAGYHREYGYNLMRDENVLAAMREETTKRLSGAALIGVNTIIDIARNGKHKDQLKAAIKLAELTGYTSEQRIVVEHINHDMKGQLARIKNMAQQLGLDARQLIAQAGITDPDVIDAEFTEVEVGTSGITDDTSE